MSEILGPYPPIRIMITLDERTGAVTCQSSKPMPVFTMVATLSQLITQFVTEAARAQVATPFVKTERSDPPTVKSNLQPKEMPNETPAKTMGNGDAT